MERKDLTTESTESTEDGKGSASVLRLARIFVRRTNFVPRASCPCRGTGRMPVVRVCLRLCRAAVQSRFVIPSQFRANRINNCLEGDV